MTEPILEVNLLISIGLLAVAYAIYRILIED
jgi:hypothetical protein